MSASYKMLSINNLEVQMSVDTSNPSFKYIVPGDSSEYRGEQKGASQTKVTTIKVAPKIDEETIMLVANVFFTQDTDWLIDKKKLQENAGYIIGEITRQCPESSWEAVASSTVNIVNRFVREYQGTTTTTVIEAAVRLAIQEAQTPSKLPKQTSCCTIL